ncbi:MAG: flagellar basal body rod modification protein, partial [Proteobacteria bacterium]|nr:flagellar basal body rod modification protein [Pseudomonadota bacterium]
YSPYVDVAVTSSGVVYGALSSSGAQPGVWRSTDGVSWTDITPGGFPATYNRIVLSVAPSNENVVYFLLQQPDTTTTGSQVRGHQLWKYTHTAMGGIWENRGGNLPLEAGLSGNARFDSQGGYDLWLQVKPDDENFLIVGGTNLYRSTDAFATTSNWLRIGGYANPTTYANYTNQHADQHSGAFKTGSSLIYFSGHDGGLSRTSNIAAIPVNWTTMNNGYQTSQFYTVAVDHASSGDPEVLGGTQDNGTWWTSSSSGSASWIDAFSGDGAFCAIANGSSYYYLSSQNGNMYRVQWNSSGVWTNWANIQPTGGGNYLFINPFTLDPNNTNMMYLAGGDRVWRNTDLTAVPAF